MYSISFAHVLIAFVHIYMIVNKLCCNLLNIEFKSFVRFSVWGCCIG